MSTARDSLRDGGWLTAERLRAYSLILVIGYVLFGIWYIWTAMGPVDAMGRPLGTDFANVWSTGRLALEGRSVTAYDPTLHRPFQEAAIGHDPQFYYSWHYPPQFLAVAALLALLPYTWALLAWVAMSLTIYVATMRAIMKRVAVSRDVVLIALAFPAVFANATHGQNGALSATLLGLGLLWLTRKPFASGVAFGLLAYKPQYGLLLPLVLVLEGHWRTIATAAATVVVTVALTIAVFGIESWAAFFANSSYTKEIVLEHGAAGWWKMQGIFSAVRMYGGSVQSAYVAHGLCVLLVSGSVAWLWRQGVDGDIKAGGLVLATAIATPYAFNYDMMILSVAIAFLARHGLRNGFEPYQASLLAVLWLSPLVTRDLTHLIHLPLATLVQCAVYLHLLHFTWLRVSARNGQHAGVRAA